MVSLFLRSVWADIRTIWPQILTLYTSRLRFITWNIGKIVSFAGALFWGILFSLPFLGVLAFVLFAVLSADVFPMESLRTYIQDGKMDGALATSVAANIVPIALAFLSTFIILSIASVAFVAAYGSAMTLSVRMVHGELPEWHNQSVFRMYTWKRAFGLLIWLSLAALPVLIISVSGEVLMQSIVDNVSALKPGNPQIAESIVLQLNILKSIILFVVFVGATYTMARFAPSLVLAFEPHTPSAWYAVKASWRLTRGKVIRTILTMAPFVLFFGVLDDILTTLGGVTANIGGITGFIGGSIINLVYLLVVVGSVSYLLAIYTKCILMGEPGAKTPHMPIAKPILPEVMVEPEAPVAVS